MHRPALKMDESANQFDSETLGQVALFAATAVSIKYSHKINFND